MPRLVAFGDSFTYGQGLDGTPEAHQYPHPQSWPYTLGKLFGVDEVINQSIPGASNKLIWLTAANFEFRPDDIVIICWSCNSRWAIFKDLPNTHYDLPTLHHLLGNQDKNIVQYGVWMVDDDPQVRDYYNYHFDMLDVYLDLCSRIDHLSGYIGGLTGNCFHTCIPNAIDLVPLVKHLTYRTRAYYKNVTEDYIDISHYDEIERAQVEVLRYGKPVWFQSELLTSMDEDKDKHGVGPDGGHLSLEAYNSFSQRLHQIISDENPEILDRLSSL